MDLFIKKSIISLSLLLAAQAEAKTGVLRIVEHHNDSSLSVREQSSRILIQNGQPERIDLWREVSCEISTKVRFGKTVREIVVREFPNRGSAVASRAYLGLQENGTVAVYLRRYLAVFTAECSIED